jgi:ABC-type thiamin/hydroxymethylpyrimidine transport system permease subunit
LLNFFAPAAGVGLIASLFAKLIWRRTLRSSSLVTLSLLSMGAGAVALVGGLLVFGRDGKMATYAVLVLVVALILWWRGLARA